MTRASKHIDVEIFVVDNNSTDGSKEFFEGRFDNVKFTWNEVNLGFGKANNLALKQAIGEYILFLNPDTILPEDCLDKSLSFFQNQHDAGAIGIRMIDGTGRFLKESKRSFPSLSTAFYKLSGLAALFPGSAVFARYYLGQLDPHRNHVVDVLAGAFMMVPQKVLGITGGFDERFFMYGEDVDLSYRIQRAGFKNFYFAESTIIHFKGESTKRGSLNYVRLFYGAMGLFVQKHYISGFGRFYTLLIRVAIWTGATISALGHRISRLFRYRNEVPTTMNSLIVADKKEFDFIESVLQNYKGGPKIIGRVSPNYLVEEEAIGNLHQLTLLLRKHAIKEIIFGMDGITAKETIGLLQGLPGDIHSRFHFAGTFSIVGSDQKELRR
ncbi:MAG: glycosyltransferase [Ferruginibacter sp.]|nr:glycosyltransferase [Ferruginibacter sp.]